jgi:thiol-disulfide isomerase/thioredoxin
MLRPTRAILAAILGLLAAAARADLAVGDSFPSLASAGLSGALPDTEGRVVLVDFWASWCAPCKASFPAYARLQADYAARGLVIVAISVDQDSAAYAAFVDRFHPPFATMHDGAQRLVSQVKVPAMPTCYLLSRNGRVRYLHQGFHGEATERELRRQIDSLLVEKTPLPK